jgi:Carboxypeptidase regulatory-like domain
MIRSGSVAVAYDRPSWKRMMMLVLMLFATSIAWTQATTSLRGTVTDPDGKAVMGANVVLANAESRIERTVTTGNQGEYQFLLVPPGSYTLTVRAAGFRGYEQRDLVLLVNTPATANVALKIGAAIC